jgi:hypothetical protein
MKNLFYNLRFWILDHLGKRVTYKYYLGHGNYEEENGWEVFGRFYKL